MELSVYSGFLNNSIILIDAIPDGELNTARKLYEDLIHVATGEYGRPKLFNYRVKTRNDFLKLVDKIENECRLYGVKPIIHIEAHGDEQKGLYIHDDNIPVTWDEFIVATRKINIQTGNNLGIVMAVCSGMYAIKPLRIQDPAPFYFLMGSEKELIVAELENTLFKFYKTLIETNSLRDAMSVLPHKIKQFNADEFLVRTVIRYFRTQCMGKGGQRRAERLLTYGVVNGHIQTGPELTEKRKLIKRTLKPSRELINKYISIFLHGKSHINSEELLEFSKKMKWDPSD